MEVDAITGHIVDAAVKLHRRTGPGLLESAYRAMLAWELRNRGLCVESEKYVTYEHDGMILVNAYRIDLLVEEAVIVEVKAVEKIADVHRRQVVTYLRLMKLPAGLLINFGAALLKDGIQRFVNDYVPPPDSPLRVNAARESQPSKHTDRS